MNVIMIASIRGVCKKFKHFITKHSSDFHYFDSLNMVGNLPNIYVLKILQRFPNISLFRTHSKITTSELSRFLDIIKTTVIEIET
jgi:hypothetical protein